MKIGAALLLAVDAGIGNGMKFKTVLLLGALAGLVGCQSAQEKEKLQQREQMQKMLLFQETDVTRDRLVNLKEFRYALRGKSPKDVDALFMRFDRDGNGVINIKEWMSVR